MSYRDSYLNAPLIHNVNVVGTAIVVKAAVRCGVRALIGMASISIVVDGSWEGGSSLPPFCFPVSSNCFV